MKFRVLALGLITAAAVALVAVSTAGARHKHVGVSGSISVIGKAAKLRFPCGGFAAPYFPVRRPIAIGE